MRICLYRPEIAGNVGAVLRLAACLGVGVDIIEPTGFAFSDARMKRAGMDYIDQVDMVRHPRWDAYHPGPDARLILLSTHASTSLYDFVFTPHDVLLFGQESAGMPDDVRERCTAQIRIPLKPAARSLNLSVATGIAVAEALRQTKGLPLC